MENKKLNIFSAGKRGKTALLSALTLLLLILFPNTAKDSFFLCFGGVVTAFLLHPLCVFFERKLSPSKAAALALATAAAALVLGAVLLLPLIVRQASALIQKLPDTAARLKSFAASLFSEIGVSFSGFLPSSFNFSTIQGNISSFARNAMDYAGVIADNIYRFVLMAVLGCFILADRQRILLRAELLLPSMQRKNLIRHAGILVSELKMYIRGQATIALCVGGIASLALLLIGVPGGILLGAVVGAFNIIPYFGPFIGGIPAVLAALGEGWQKAAMTLAALVIVQQIDGMVISPRVMGSATGFSAGTVLIALFAFSRLFGIAGLLFAMPVLMAIRTLYRVFVQRYEKN